MVYVIGEPIVRVSRNGTTSRDDRYPISTLCNKVNTTYGVVDTGTGGSSAGSTSVCVCNDEPQGCGKQWKGGGPGPDPNVSYEQDTICDPNSGMCTTVYTVQQPSLGLQEGTKTNYCVETITEQGTCHFFGGNIPNPADCICPSDSGGPETNSDYPEINIDTHAEAQVWATTQHGNLSSQADCGPCKKA